MEFLQTLRGEDLGRWSEIRPVMREKEDMIRVVMHQIHVMRNEQHGEPFVLLQTANQRVDVPFARLVDTSRWLIKEEYCRAANEREREEEPLQLATRQRADPLVGDLCREIHQRHDALYISVVCVRDVCFRAQEVSTGEREVARDVELLRDIPDVRPRHPANGSLRRNCSDQCLEEYRLSGAIASDDRQCAPSFDAEAEVIDDANAIKCDGQIGDLERMRHGRSGSAEVDSYIGRDRAIL